jgi:hypothetical protein
VYCCRRSHGTCAVVNDGSRPPTTTAGAQPGVAQARALHDGRSTEMFRRPRCAVRTRACRAAPAPPHRPAGRSMLIRDYETAARLWISWRAFSGGQAACGQCARFSLRLRFIAINWVGWIGGRSPLFIELSWSPHSERDFLSRSWGASTSDVAGD